MAARCSYFTRASIMDKVANFCAYAAIVEAQAGPSPVGNEHQPGSIYATHSPMQRRNNLTLSDDIGRDKLRLWRCWHDKKSLPNQSIHPRANDGRECIIHFGISCRPGKWQKKEKILWRRRKRRWRSLSPPRRRVNREGIQFNCNTMMVDIDNKSQCEGKFQDRQ